MSKSYMESTMEALIAELDMLRGVDTTDAEAVETATRHAKAVQGVAEQVFDGQRVNNETVRTRCDLIKCEHVVDLVGRSDLVGRRIPPKPKERPYYAQLRDAESSTENQEFFRDTVRVANE
jgi:hypothetical protein